MNEATPVIEIAQNTLERDFVVGDIHGCFSTVEHALAALDCDLSRGRLFSVGDLIDHGARSDEALAWISGSVLHFEAQEHRTSNEAAPRADEACTGRGRRAGFPGARASCPHGRSWPIRSRRSAVAEHGWARSFTLKIALSTVARVLFPSVDVHDAAENDDPILPLALLCASVRGIGSNGASPRQGSSGMETCGGSFRTGVVRRSCAFRRFMVAV